MTGSASVPLPCERALPPGGGTGSGDPEAVALLFGEMKEVGMVSSGK